MGDEIFYDKDVTFGVPESKKYSKISSFAHTT